VLWFIAIALIVKPLFEDSVFFNDISKFAFIPVVWLAACFLDRRPFSDFGFHLGWGWFLDLGFGLLLGALLVAVIFLIECQAGWIKITGYFVPNSTSMRQFIADFIVAILIFVGVGLSEELVFRGYCLKNIAEDDTARRRSQKFSVLFACVLSSTLFGLSHLVNKGVTPLAVINTILAGLMFGLSLILTGEIAIPIGLHITFDLFESHIFGFPIGGATNTPSIIGLTQSGPELWTGGIYGPVAGLITWPVMLLGTVLILLWIKWRTGGLMIQSRLASPPPFT